jgi:3-deoxy-D-manno-octulosonate 8-phosphate phosphatase (KDO 8-P phosphatase)
VSPDTAEPENRMEQARTVKLVILDVDGVMSDGRIVIDDNGVEQRNFDIKDGFAVVALQMSGIDVAIITSKKSGSVRHRAEELKIKRFHEGIKKKTEPYEQMLAEMGITDVEEVKSAAAYVTKARGGYGAVREAAEMILKTQGKWEKLLAKVA